MNDQWQPIETAPKDGAGFIGYNLESMLYSIAWCGWFSEDDNPVWFNGDSTVDLDCWMPLPAPPHHD